MIRRCTAADDAAAAALVRLVLEGLRDSIALDLSGTVYVDPTLDHLSQCGQYYVYEGEDGRILGGAGFSQQGGMPRDVAELVRVFVHPDAQGRGIGRALVAHCIDEARAAGFHTLYLESITSLSAALRLYESMGFQRIPGALGCTGHNGCDVFMTIALRK